MHARFSSSLLAISTAALVLLATASPVSPSPASPALVRRGNTHDVISVSHHNGGGDEYEEEDGHMPVHHGRSTYDGGAHLPAHHGRPEHDGDHYDQPSYHGGGAMIDGHRGNGGRVIHDTAVIDDHRNGGRSETVSRIETVTPIGGGVDAAHMDRLGHPAIGAHRGGGMMSLDAHALSPALLSRNSYFTAELFTMYNPKKGKCLKLKEGKRPKLGSENCSPQQHFDPHSDFAFHWVPVENNLAHLAIFHAGERLCATAHRTGTYLEPCSDKSIKYSLSEDHDEGSLFSIRDAGRSSQCMSVSSSIRMRTCSHSKKQKWDKVHIAFMG